MKRLLVGLLALGLLAGCSTVSSRIKEKPEAYSHLAPRDQQLVRAGKVREGFSQDAVFLAWGKADLVNQGSRRGRKFETWTYLAAETVQSRPLIYPYYYGDYYGWRGRRGIWYDDFDQTQVYPYCTATFEHGRLAAWSDQVR